MFRGKQRHMKLDEDLQHAQTGGDPLAAEGIRGVVDILGHHHYRYRTRILTTREFPGIFTLQRSYAAGFRTLSQQPSRIPCSFSERREERQADGTGFFHARSPP